jgi:hypothetical protein
MATLRAAQIKPGTTPILSVSVDGQDIADATIYVTIRMAGRTLIKTNRYDDESVTAETTWAKGVPTTLVSVQYSQADTLYLRPGNASIEVSWIFEDGSADKSNMERLFIPKTLFREVMTYGRYTSDDIEWEED